MKTLRLYTIPFFSLLIFFSACEDQGDPVSPVVIPPTLQSIVPDSAAVGDTVTINGKKFGTAKGSSSVNFGSVAAIVFVSWNDSTIRVKVPANAATGNVTVKVNGATSAGKQFKVIGTVSLISFLTDIRPLITTYNCASCHPNNGGFSVTNHADIITRVTVNNGDASLLVQKLRGTAPGNRMPNGGPTYMSTTEIQKFVDWINQGALNN